ncbi:MAG: hypothetical protein WC529_05845 [Candidatus Margulisiibacteriota bacterium]
MGIGKIFRNLFAGRAAKAPKPASPKKPVAAAIPVGPPTIPPVALAPYLRPFTLEQTNLKEFLLFIKQTGSLARKYIFDVSRNILALDGVSKSQHHQIANLVLGLQYSQQNIVGGEIKFSYTADLLRIQIFDFSASFTKPGKAVEDRLPVKKYLQAMIKGTFSPDITFIEEPDSSFLRGLTFYCRIAG